MRATSRQERAPGAPRAPLPRLRANTRRLEGKDTGVPVIGPAVVQDQVNGVHLVDLERREKTNLHTGSSLGSLGDDR